MRQASVINCDQWATKPNPKDWSAAEVAAHLKLVETGIVFKATRVCQKTPKHFSVWQRLHLPLLLAERRLIRFKAPDLVDPLLSERSLVDEKEKMLSDLRSAREASLTFLEETKSRDLSDYRWNHPFLGNLSLYGWFELIAAHEVRHTRQMREIGNQLRKVV
jgi:hypothetical protein